MSDLIMSDDPLTHGFGLEDTEEGTWRRIAIAKRASGKYEMKIEVQRPGQERKSLNLQLTRRALQMLLESADRGLNAIHQHPVRDGMLKEL